MEGWARESRIPTPGLMFSVCPLEGIGVVAGCGDSSPSLVSTLAAMVVGGYRRETSMSYSREGCC